jgi:hypothetical protein
MCSVFVTVFILARDTPAVPDDCHWSPVSFNAWIVSAAFSFSTRLRAILLLCIFCILTALSSNSSPTFFCFAIVCILFLSRSSSLCRRTKRGGHNHSRP